MDAEEAFNAIGAAILELPDRHVPEGKSEQAHYESLPEADRTRLRIGVLAEQAAARILEGLARGEDAVEPTDAEVEEVCALVQPRIVSD